MESEMTVLYHHSTTAHLPWIVKSQELQPEANLHNDFYDWALLWATEHPGGDRTATSGIYRDEVKKGMARYIRFTLPEAAFVPWNEYKAGCNPDGIEAVETRARQLKVDPQLWWCREQPLELSKVLEIHHRGVDGAWHPLDDTQFVRFGRYQNTLGIRINDTIYAAMRDVGDDGLAGYICGEPIHQSGTRP